MAELLVRLIDVPITIPQDSAFCFRAGDPIRAEDDGHKWTPKESLAAWIAAGNAQQDWHGRTFLLKMPGVPTAKLESLVVPELDANFAVTKARAWNVQIAGLSSALQDKITGDGGITVTKAQIQAFIRRKADNAQAAL